MTSNLEARCSVTVDLRFFLIRLGDEVLFQLVEHHQDRDFVGSCVGKHGHCTHVHIHPAVIHLFLVATPSL